MINFFETYRSKTAVLIISFICIVLFINTLHNSFMWDDKELIENNYHIKTLERIPFLFSTDYWNYYHAGTKGQYRPMRTLTFACDYAISKMQPAGYHITNMLLHLFNSLLVFALFKSIFKIAAVEQAKAKSIVLFGAAFFAAHPIHTESIAWIKNRSDLLCLFFMLAAIMSFIKFIKKNNWIYYAGALASFTASIFSKEMALSLPFILIGLIVCLISPKKRFKIFLQIIPMFIIGVLFVLFKKYYLGMVVDQQMAESIGIYSHILAVIKTIGTYLWLLVYPFQLSAERIFYIPVSIAERSVLASIALIALLITGIFKSIKKENILAFSLIWMVMAILPAANILFIWSRPIAEQRLYIPSVGFCLFLAIVIHRFGKTSKSKLLGLILCMLVLFSYSARTILRNKDWVNPLVFWKKAVEASPESARAHTNLGNAYAEQNDYEKAAFNFKQAIKLDDQHAEAYNNLGNIYAETARSNLLIAENSSTLRAQLARALKLFDQAIELNPGNYDAYNNIGAIYEMLDDYNKADQYYKKSLSLNEYYDKAYLNLGLMNLSKGNLEKSEEYFKKSIEVNPDYAHAYNNLGVVYENMGKTDKALSVFKKVIEIDPEYINAYYNLGYNYLLRDQQEKAIEYFNRTKQADPSHIDAYQALGILYARSGDFEKAVKEYSILLKLDPDNPQACNNISYAYFKTGQYELALKYNEKAKNLGFPVSPEFDAQLEPYRNKNADNHI